MAKHQRDLPSVIAECDGIYSQLRNAVFLSRPGRRSDRHARQLLRKMKRAQKDFGSFLSDPETRSMLELLRCFSEL